MCLLVCAACLIILEAIPSLKCHSLPNFACQIALNTMREYDVDGDDKLNLQEFKALLSTTDLHSKFGLNV